MPWPGASKLSCVHTGYGTSLAHWFQMEFELGVVSEAETENALARIDEVAAAVIADDRPLESTDSSDRGGG